MQSITTLLITIVFLAACKTGEKTSKKSKGLTNEIDTLSYAIGVSVANGIYSQGIKEINPKLVEQGFADIFNGEDSLPMDVQFANQYLNLYFAEMGAKMAEQKIKEQEEFLEANKSKEGVMVTESGLQYKILKKGEGESPSASSKVTTHYEGRLPDGTVFDSSYKRGEPATFPVNGVIPGWTEALQMMKLGSKWRLWLPANLAYGERGAGEMIGPNQMLIFDVELISFE